MDLTTKMRYEISLWEDKQQADGTTSESRIAVLGSNELNSPANVFEPVFTKKIDGSNSLTFSIYAKYRDEETNELVNNSYVQFLHNECKIKLKYYPTTSSTTPEWYDFVIKKVDESSDNCKISYTATDFYVKELAKTGFELEFNTDLENNIGTLNFLAQKILQNTGWSYEVVGDNLDTKEETLFWAKGTTENSTTKFFIFYSAINNKTYYEENGALKSGYQLLKVQGDIEHSNGVITNGVIEYVSTMPTYNSTPSIYRGNSQVWTPELIYDKRLEKYVSKYNPSGHTGNWSGYAGYTETDYITSKNVINFLTNGYSITTDSGWADVNEQSLEPSGLPRPKNSGDWKNINIYGIKLPKDKNNKCILFNSGFTDNLKNILPISTNKEYCARFKFAKSDGTAYTPSDTDLKLTFKIYSYENNKLNIKTTNYLTLGKESTTHKFYTSCKFNTEYTLDYVNNSSTTRSFFLEISNLPNEDIYLTEAEFFEKIKDSSGNILLPTGKSVVPSTNVESTDVSTWSEIKTTYYYYNYNQSVTTKNAIVYKSIGEENNTYNPVYSNQKRRTITAKESNRFNLLQTLAELFEMWCVLKITHNSSGTVTQKKVQFIKNIGNIKEVPTIKYGLNLKSIKRTLDSDKIATKLIVKSNSNEFATDGSCNIAKAALNPSKENFLLNFDYYLNRKIILKEILDSHLYTNLMNGSDLGKNVESWVTQGAIGLYTGLKQLNQVRDQKIITQAALLKNYSSFKSGYEVASQLYLKTQEKLLELKGELHSITGYTYDQFLSSATGTASLLTLDNVASKLEDIKLHTQELNKYTQEKNTNQTGLTNTTNALTTLDTELDYIETATKLLIRTFETKYRSYIQEASWISEVHTDDELYYLDAEAVLRGSAFPKISYTIDALDLGYHPDYKYFHYDLADVIMVEDTENFGWAPATGEAFKEQFVITEVKINFESPEKNSISTKNYRTSFLDLFQRLAATTQQLQFHEGDWNKTSKVVEGTQITSKALSNAFANNANILANISNQSVVWDDKGITTTNTLIPSEITRITSAGIFLTDSGGRQWTTGITPKGINAKIITTGQLNTDKVVITSGDQAAFRWDKDGLNAYASVFDTSNKFSNYTIDSFVRFDQYGIYGIKSGDGFSQTGLEQENYESRDGYLRANSSFSLTRTGINIGKCDKDSPGYLLFTTNDGKLKIKGEIEATKLTLGGDVSLEEYLPDVVIPDNVLTFEDLDPDSVLTAEDVEIGKLVEGPNGYKYKVVTVGGQPFTVVQNEDFIYTNFAYGNNKDFEQATQFTKISTDGLLQAKNAIIYGTIYATDGEFNGTITSNSAFIGQGNQYLKFNPSTGLEISAESITITSGATNGVNLLQYAAPPNNFEITGSNTIGATSNSATITSGDERVASEFMKRWNTMGKVSTEQWRYSDGRRTRVIRLKSTGGYAFIGQVLNLSAGKKYTFTVKGRQITYGQDHDNTSNPTATVGLRVNIKANSGKGESKWYREIIPTALETNFGYHYSVEVPETDDYMIEFYTKKGGEVCVYELKLEQGTTATPWSPSTYDNVASLSILKESIDAKVENSATGNGFGWQLTADGFGLYSYQGSSGNVPGNQVFWSDKDGVILGKTSGSHIKFNSTNSELDIKVNSLKVTNGISGPNLLTQTAPGAFYKTVSGVSQTSEHYDAFFKSWSVEGGHKSKISAIIPPGGRERAIYLNKHPSYSRRVFIQQSCDKLQANKKYTISGYYIGRNLKIGIYHNDTKEWEYYTVPNGGTASVLRFFKYTFTSGSNYGQTIRFEQHTYDTTYDFCLYHLKLERGENETDWDSNSRDVEYVTQAISDEVSSMIEQLPNQITAQVNSGSDGGTSGGFGWTLDRYGFTLFTQKGTSSSAVLECDSGGIEITGKITATGGSIGGWTLNKTSTYSSLTSGTIGANNSIHLYTYYPTSTQVTIGGRSGSDWRLAIGSHFGVNNSGNLYCNGGKIGGWSISDGLLSSSSSSSKTLKLDAGASNGYFISCISGDDVLFGVNSAGRLYTTSAQIGYGSQYLMYTTSGGLIISGNITASSGQIGAWEITGVNGSLLQISTEGASIGAIGGEIFKDQLGYWKKTAANVYESRTAGWNSVVNSAWNYANTASLDSDINVKNSILPFTLEYEDFFDNLKPCKYKYNHGTSNRYHTGFIAQEVVESIEKTGLTTLDFAGVVHLKEPNENGSEWLLRRDEFVALNTWQIQKLKQRVKELEEKLAQMEIKGGVLNDQ